MSRKVAVVGAGSFGSALAKLLAEGGHGVKLWARDQAVVDQLNQEHVHPRRLAGVRFPPGMVATADLPEALADAELVISAVPTVALREVWSEGASHLPTESCVVSATKGIENDSLLLVSEMLTELVGERIGGRLCYLSGPSFALELCRRHPTAVTLAADDEALANDIQKVISTDYFRIYTTTDVKGVELGGAIKNVMAIAAGAADGLGLGLNANAALITRGLAEMTRLAVNMGAWPLTMAGLAGLGDLVLTCTGGLSRNRRVGFRLGQGAALDTILEELGEVAEGVYTTRSVKALCEREEVEMPIAQAVHALLFEGADPRETVYQLMGRKLKAELE
jgi:glycerol-3-phosphate dehydrogenase (NAD(P)+)